LDINGAELAWDDENGQGIRQRAIPSSEPLAVAWASNLWGSRSIDPGMWCTQPPDMATGTVLEDSSRTVEGNGRGVIKQNNFYNRIGNPGSRRTHYTARGAIDLERGGKGFFVFDIFRMGQCSPSMSINPVNYRKDDGKMDTGSEKRPQRGLDAEDLDYDFGENIVEGVLDLGRHTGYAEVVSTSSVRYRF
jgi:hypothetical protein